MLDGGITNGGLPYFALELVDGEPIDRYCQSRDLSIDQRIDLFGRVCDAVSYAHQHLVIHRDLKPSNILEECASFASRSCNAKIAAMGYHAGSPRRAST